VTSIASSCGAPGRRRRRSGSSGSRRCRTSPRRRNGLNFTLDTDLGPLDLLGEVPGLGTFDRVDAASSELEIDGARLLVLTLDGLERSKRAAGRPKDLVDLGYLRALRE
jgi:hypothetical protein